MSTPKITSSLTPAPLRNSATAVAAWSTASMRLANLSSVVAWVTRKRHGHSKTILRVPVESYETPNLSGGIEGVTCATAVCQEGQQAEFLAAQSLKRRHQFQLQLSLAWAAKVKMRP